MDGFAVIFPIIFIIAFIAIIVNIGKAAKKTNNKSRPQYYSSGSVNRNSAIRQADPKTVSVVKERPALKSSLVDKYDSHNHPGDSGIIENYEEIYGSLGKVNDEGCTENLGIRFVEPIPLNEDDSVNYDEISRMIIIGETISKPRFRRRH